MQGNDRRVLTNDLRLFFLRVFACERQILFPACKGHQEAIRRWPAAGHQSLFLSLLRIAAPGIPDGQWKTGLICRGGLVDNRLLQ
jgi:hypothetical protein